MREALIECLMMTFSTCFIISHSGIVFKINRAIYSKLNKDRPYKGQSIPLISCPLCISFWITSLLMYNYTENIIQSITFGCIFAILSTLINKIIGIILQTIQKIK